MRMIATNANLIRYTEVIRLSDKLCMEQDLIPELDLHDNLYIHRLRHAAYCHIGDHDRKAAMEKRLQATLKSIGESCDNHNGITSNVLFERGCAYYTLGEDDMALESFELALKAFERSQCSRFTEVSRAQFCIAWTYEALGRYHEAK